MALSGRGKLFAAVAGVAAAGATWFYIREKRRTESPSYVIDASEGPIELRHYPALVVAETIQPGTRDRALGNGFGLLADYVFAESRQGEELPMTVPVVAIPIDEENWAVRFVMPEGRALASLPAPGPGVKLVEVPVRAVAAIRFGGTPSDRLLAQKEAELRKWLAARGAGAVGPAEHAYYNSPMIPGPLKQNEVQVAVLAKTEQE
ncbi:heme-binding protein [Sphingomonas naphthae]|uniref:Heme-binding protein n=1 Tax=Sphingomonas naphthae TaxID=1813468 RepID=A0ABY7TKB0_9SPHN|nr:heme-binding protein [Sphingomonas naphthae]WCT73666.1 heme-binding protein [Sphingomonas naphthae]